MYALPVNAEQKGPILRKEFRELTNNNGFGIIQAVGNLDRLFCWEKQKTYLRVSVNATHDIGLLLEEIMSNLAFGKPILESINHPEIVTNGEIKGYTGNSGFAWFYWPGYLTVDLGSNHSLRCIRFLLWDNLGNPTNIRNVRIYKYRLLVSSDNQNWKVVFDTGSSGFSGWQCFNFNDGIEVRYIRLHGIWNSVNPQIHVVEIEAHDSQPPELEAEYTLTRNITIPTHDSTEVGDGMPLALRVGQIIDKLERFSEENEIFNSSIISQLISQLRAQIRDIDNIERSMDSIRREITSPVKIELNRMGKIIRRGNVIGLIGGILAIIALLRALL